MWPYKTGDLLKEVQLTWNFLWQVKKKVTFYYRWLLNRGDHIDCMFRTGATFTEYDLINLCYMFSNSWYKLFRTVATVTEYDIGYVALVVSASQSFPHSWLMTGYVAKVARRVSYPFGVPDVRFMLVDLLFSV